MSEEACKRTSLCCGPHQLRRPQLVQQGLPLRVQPLCHIVAALHGPAQRLKLALVRLRSAACRGVQGGDGWGVMGVRG